MTNGDPSFLNTIGKTFGTSMKSLHRQRESKYNKREALAKRRVQIDREKKTRTLLYNQWKPANPKPQGPPQHTNRGLHIQTERQIGG